MPCHHNFLNWNSLVSRFGQGCLGEACDAFKTFFCRASFKASRFALPLPIATAERVLLKSHLIGRMISVRKEHFQSADCDRTHHQKTGIAALFTEGLVRGNMNWNLRHSTWPSSIPMLPPLGKLRFKWEVLAGNEAPPSVLSVHWYPPTEAGSF